VRARPTAVYRTVALSILAVVVASGASACSVDPSPLSSFFDLRVVNDTNHSVKIEPCWDPSCRDTTGMPTDTVNAGAYRDEAAWSNSAGGTVAVAVIDAKSGSRKCLPVRYERGQKKGRVRVSGARRCA
jgi:hypothetical protein